MVEEARLGKNAGVPTETTESAEAYAPYPERQPGPPPSCAGTPWDGA